MDILKLYRHGSLFYVNMRFMALVWKQMCGITKALVWPLSRCSYCLVGVVLRLYAYGVLNLDVAREMDEAVPDIEKSLEPYLSHFGHRSDGSRQSAVLDLLENERFTHNKSPLTDIRKGWPHSCGQIGFARLITILLGPRQSTSFSRGSSTHASNWIRH